MKRKHPSWIIYVLAAASLLLTGRLCTADEKDQPSKKPTVNKPTIEFQQFPGEFKGCKFEFELNMIVTFEGTAEKFETSINGKKGFSGLGQRVLFEAIVEDDTDRNWKYSTENEKLVLEGWTDPKTKKFHPVKSIKFESKNLPKECMPTVEMPPNL